MNFKYVSELLWLCLTAQILDQPIVIVFDSTDARPTNDIFRKVQYL